MENDLLKHKAKIYYFPRLRNFGLVYKVENGVITLISPFYSKGDEINVIAKIDSNESRIGLSYIKNNGILLVDGQMLIDKVNGDRFVINVLDDKSIKIRHLDTDEDVDFLEVSKMIKKEMNGEDSYVSTIYHFKGNFEEELSPERMIGIMSSIGSGTGTIELSKNLYQIAK